MVRNAVRFGVRVLMTDTHIPASEVPNGERCGYCGRRAGEVTYSTSNGVPFGPGLVVPAPTVHRSEVWSDSKRHEAYFHDGCLAQLESDWAELVAGNPVTL